MDLSLYASRDLLISRIISGILRVKIKNQLFTIVCPSREDLYISNEVYWDTYYEAESNGCFLDEDILEMLISKGLWSSELDNQIKVAEEDLENIKVKLFETEFKTQEREMARSLIKAVKKKIAELNSKRHQYDYTSCSGVAQSAKHRYLITACLRDARGNPLFSQDLWREDIEILDAAIVHYNDSQIKESEYRYLARTEPWRSIWVSGKHCGALFDSPGIDLTEEQRSLILWSQMFDNIYESPDCPSDDVIADDDMLDGWLILQRRKRKEGADKKRAEDSISNEKIKNSQDIYMVAQSDADIRKIGGFNDAYNNMIRKQRMGAVRERGEVNELEMPDTKLDMRMQFVNQQRERFKR